MYFLCHDMPAHKYNKYLHIEHRFWVYMSAHDIIFVPLNAYLLSFSITDIF